MNTKLQDSNLISEINQRKFLNIDFNSNRIDRRKEFSIEERTKIVIEGQGSDVSIEEICDRESILPITFYQWTQEFLGVINSKPNVSFEKKISDVKKFNNVIEAKSGVSSVAEICRRENISHETFLEWNQSFIEARKSKLKKIQVRNLDFKKNRELIKSKSNSETLRYIENYVDLATERIHILSNSNDLLIDSLNSFDGIVSLQKVNDIRFINKYFEKINSKLSNGGIFIGCLETFTARRKRKKINKIPIIGNIYFAFEFLIKRILPKLSLTKKHYFDITKGNDRLLSKAEGLGRLVSCGFHIIDYKSIDGLIYFIVKKVGKPNFDLNPSYGPIFKMSRIGKNGKTIGVFKFRTMHPYSEYIQDYVLKANGYASSGKPANDFRVPVWAKILRKYWLDELPQLINVLKGEMKLVGIRPVSQRYLQDIPKEMQKLRLTQKPGCIPPYVSLNSKSNVMSVLQSERHYLEEKIKNPYFTDTKYFLKAIFNIVFKHKRSA